MSIGEIIEWDEAKAKANARKHGVSFYEALKIWSDPGYVRVRLSCEGEPRWLVVGRIAKNSYISAIITYRGNPERPRIISARRSSAKEKELYHG